MKRNKLNAAQVQSIRVAGIAMPPANPERLGKQFGVSVSTIKAILTRKTWKNVEPEQARDSALGPQQRG